MDAAPQFLLNDANARAFALVTAQILLARVSIYVTIGSYLCVVRPLLNGG
jgi:hypothetical protein